MMSKRICFLTAMLLLLFAAEAFAARTFAVLPFEINGPDKYKNLSQGIQSMLSSRLSQADKLVSVDRDKVAKAAAPASKDKAQELMAQLGADYLVWGSVTMLGEEASLDIQIGDRQGGSWTKSAQSKIDGLIPALEKVSKEIGAEVLKKGDAKPEQAAKQPGQPGQPAIKPAGLNSEIIYNETKENGEYILNPDIRYEGNANPTRWNSQSLYFPSRGAVVGDADGDGKAEVFIIGDDKLRAYTWQPNGLNPAGEWALPSGRYKPLKLNLLSLHRDGTKQIIVSGIQDESPYSVVLNYEHGRFTVETDRISMYLNVVRTPPEYQETLVGQAQGQGGKPFDKNYVHEVQRMDGKYVLGKKLRMPDHAYIFNFAYLPQENGDHKLIIVDSYDHLRVHSADASLMATTDEAYAGSSIEIEYVEHAPGLGRPNPAKGAPTDAYYIPLRLIPTDFDNDHKFELLVNRDVSVSAQFFQRYRYFPQGELHSLAWDGVGMSLVWKTRSIKGSVTDYGIADLDGDGKPELWVCVNSHPGMSGLSSIRTTIVSYPLDLSTFPQGEGGAPVRKVKMQ